MAVCPTCGQQVARPKEAEWLLDVLTNATPHREVYRGRDGHWYVTYGGDEASPQAVEELKRRGAISSKYSNIPDEVYHVGRTIDYERTLSDRRRLGKKNSRTVYVGDPATPASS